MDLSRFKVANTKDDSVKSPDPETADVEARKIPLEVSIDVSVDAAEVFEADLGPRRDIYGPITVGMLHFSITAPVDEQIDDPKLIKQNHAVFKAVIGILSSEISKLNPIEDSARPSEDKYLGVPLAIYRSEYEDAECAPIDDGQNWIRIYPLDWLIRSFFGGSESEAKAGTLYHKGTHFAAMGPPLAIGDRREYDLNSEEEGKARLTELSSLSRHDSAARSVEVTSRVYASASRRGTVLLNKGGRLEGSFYTTSLEDYVGISGDDLRNFRSYWIQGLLFGMVQHQALKRFSAELGTLGGDVRQNLRPMTDIYEAWLEFRNVAWWADLTYETPPEDRLLESFRDTHHSQRIFEELEGDLETYISYASRKQDEATNQKLAWLQVGGVGLVVLGGWGAIVDVGTRGGFSHEGEVITSVIVAMLLALGTALLLLAPRRK